MLEFKVYCYQRYKEKYQEVFEKFYKKVSDDSKVVNRSINSIFYDLYQVKTKICDYFDSINDQYIDFCTGDWIELIKRTSISEKKVYNYQFNYSKKYKC